jgi:hypothetical protein
MTWSKRYIVGIHVIWKYKPEADMHYILPRLTYAVYRRDVNSIYRACQRGSLRLHVTNNSSLSLIGLFAEL